MKPRTIAGVLALAIAVPVLSAQTRIDPPDNNYSPAEDADIGRQAAREARQQYPLLRNRQVTSYVEDVGRRLASAIPPEFDHREFRYTFEVVNVRDINAFALPGGPMFVNRGTIQAASTEGELAGVMAHEISHVVLRHGTAQASKAGKYQLGQLAGSVLGAIVGGTAGSAIAQGTSFGLGTAFMRFGREYERQADLEGAQIMARAGYDPREMANMFKTIEREGGSGGPEWLSDHPNPGNRYDAISREASSLRVQNRVRDNGSFLEVKDYLSRLPRAPSTAQVMRNSD